ncbi:RNA polymerase II-associated protein 1-like [Pollicipes pollicipes]|uniref:RNA polymerase II-associated protein 1-like n=1 Tax=Pollicipes pollicipes TaxID=41117 RepID=UPI001884F175|nr:RNA polymerase II-associated protein 1-like [Pollicipes pollicipes]
MAAVTDSPAAGRLPAPAPEVGEDQAMEQLERVKDQLPIDLAEARKWPHMDHVEPEKLLWMTQLPAPKVEHGQTGFVARFDFEGALLPFAAAPPAHSALYHHGQEPGRAGYTVDELFRLIRSAAQQQRARPPDAGQRTAQVCLDRVLGWSRGLEQPSLPTSVDTEPDTDRQYQAEEPGLKDGDVTRLDAVRGLVRIDTLPRLRYILEVLRPSPPAVISAVRLLTRCCRHSLQLASEVAACPRLLHTLVTAFLPVCGAAPLEGCENVAQLSSVYGVPLHHVVRLLRVLAVQSAQLAGRLVRQHPVLPALLSYVAINPSESGMPTQEVLTLAVEAYRLWTVLLSYGLGDSHFIEFFPLLVRQLHFYLAAVSVNEAAETNRHNHDLATCLLALCRAAVCAAWSNHQTELLNRAGADMTAPGRCAGVTWPACWSR